MTEEVPEETELEEAVTEAAVKLFLNIFGAVTAAYGLTVFIRRDIITYMFIRTQFVFLDFNEQVPLFYIDHIAMMGTFIWLAYYASVLIRSKNDKSDGGLLASVQKGERENDRYE